MGKPKKRKRSKRRALSREQVKRKAMEVAVRKMAEAGQKGASDEDGAPGRRD